MDNNECVILLNKDGIADKVFKKSVPDVVLKSKKILNPSDNLEGIEIIDLTVRKETQFKNHLCTIQIGTEQAIIDISDLKSMEDFNITEADAAITTIEQAVEFCKKHNYTFWVGAEDDDIKEYVEKRMNEC